MRSTHFPTSERLLRVFVWLIAVGSLALAVGVLFGLFFSGTIQFVGLGIFVGLGVWASS